MIVSSNTYLADLVEKYNLGIAIDLEKDSIVEKLEDYINKFDEKLFMGNTEMLLKKVQKDEERFTENVLRFLNEDTV